MGVKAEGVLFRIILGRPAPAQIEGQAEPLGDQDDARYARGWHHCRQLE